MPAALRSTQTGSKMAASLADANVGPKWGMSSMESMLRNPIRRVEFSQRRNVRPQKPWIVLGPKEGVSARYRLGSSPRQSKTSFNAETRAVTHPSESRLVAFRRKCDLVLAISRSRVTKMYRPGSGDDSTA